ncbi:MAG: diguanylate cyclase [Anaerolineales bacterium]|uniref:histidine kinase N-terminal 7TM domain-containing protein n=1 Tax=Candidatus Villigracilis vicinus TaxID=3140679 RepID=UPI003136B6B9|nr:diguanylate cyclase [Anaerolineales bacterium]
METSLSVYLGSLAFLVIILAGIGIRALINWKKPGARTLGLLMTVMAIWVAFYLLEILLPSLPAKILARKILYLGMTLSPPFWLGFAMRYTGISASLTKRGRAFLFAIPGGVTFLLGLTNEYHHLIWRSLSASEESPAPLTLEYGPIFWLYAVFAYTFILIGIILYLIAYFKNGKVFQVKAGVALAGVILTGIINILFLLFGENFKLDPTPLSFALSAPLIAWGFFRFGVTSLFPLAASLVVENLNDAIVVTNRNEEITDINQAAARLLNIAIVQEHTLALAILPEADRIRELWNTPEKKITLTVTHDQNAKWYEVHMVPITSTDKTLVGHAIVFHDITNEQILLKAEKRRSQQLSLLEEAGRRIADSFDEKEILQRTVKVIIEKFQYPEAAISVLTKDNMLEVVAIAGAGHPGYEPGFRQPLGEGIIGRTAEIQKTYISNNVGLDPFYYSVFEYYGSAICIPIMKQEKLFGVLYVESTETNAFDELDVKTLEALANQASASLQRASLYLQTQNNLLTLATIQDVSRLIVSSLDLETISQTVVKSLKEAFGYTHVSIYILEEEYLRLSAQVGYPEEMIIYKIHVSQGVIGKTFRTRTIQFIEDTTKEKTFLKADHVITSEICVPLIKDEKVLGILNVESGKSNQLTQADVGLLTTIAGPIAVSIDNARLHSELKRMATTDAVTGLSNRHVFERALQAEVERAKQNQIEFSLIVFDADSFKQYNDTWGHPAGDVRLRAIADVIKSNLRKYDVAARYGGDEFAIILTNCNQHNAMLFAERLRRGTQAGAPHPPINGEGIPGFTISMGIATYPQDAILPADLLLAADNAAMWAKQEGRNRIKFANNHAETN